MIYVTSSAHWLLVLLIPLTIFAVIFVYRKSYRKTLEIKQQLVIAVIVLGVSVITEYTGVTFDLWHYTGGDWPVILWLVYLTGSCAGYQLVKLITEKVR